MIEVRVRKDAPDWWRNSKLLIVQNLFLFFVHRKEDSHGADGGKQKRDAQSATKNVTIQLHMLQTVCALTPRELAASVAVLCHNGFLSQQTFWVLVQVIFYLSNG